MARGPVSVKLMMYRKNVEKCENWKYALNITTTWKQAYVFLVMAIVMSSLHAYMLPHSAMLLD